MNKNTSLKKQYPSFYEKTVPIAIGILALVIIVMLAFTIGVGLGLINFA